MSKKDKAAHEAEVVEPLAGGVPPDGEPLAAEFGDGQEHAPEAAPETQSSEVVQADAPQADAPAQEQAPEAPVTTERVFVEKKVSAVQSTAPARTHVPGVGLVDVSHPEK